MSPDPMPPVFRRTTLATGDDGRARFVDEAIVLDQGGEAARLSALQNATAIQFRESPIGFRSAPHCTEIPQWVFILRGGMRIGLSDGSSRLFSPGEHFYSADILPPGASFDPAVHGHWSAQEGEEPLVTLFIKT